MTSAISLEIRDNRAAGPTSPCSIFVMVARLSVHKDSLKKEEAVKRRSPRLFKEEVVIFVLSRIDDTIITPLSQENIAPRMSCKYSLQMGQASGTHENGVIQKSNL